MITNTVILEDITLSASEVKQLELYPVNSTLFIRNPKGVNTMLYTRIKGVKGLFAYHQACKKIDYSNRKCKVVSVIASPMGDSSYYYDVIVDIGEGKSVKTFIKSDCVSVL